MFFYVFFFFLFVIPEKLFKQEKSSIKKKKYFVPSNSLLQLFIFTPWNIDLNKFCWVFKMMLKKKKKAKTKPF